MLILIIISNSVIPLSYSVIVWRWQILDNMYNWTPKKTEPIVAKIWQHDIYIVELSIYTVGKR